MRDSRQLIEEIKEGVSLETYNSSFKDLGDNQKLSIQDEILFEVISRVKREVMYDISHIMYDLNKTFDRQFGNLPRYEDINNKIKK